MPGPVALDRELVTELYDAAVTAASPSAATARAVDALSISRDARVWIFAFGKAATPMANAAVASLLRSLHSIVGGVIVSSDGAASPYPTVVAMRGDHPVPEAHSFAAAAKIADVSAGRRGNDVAIVLISGGASSLIGAPLRGMSESDLSLLYELLLGSGLDIAATNAVRKRFSRWGGGRLALALAPATTHCLAISDVADDDLRVIGSGPCVPDTTTAADVLGILQRSGLATRIPQSVSRLPHVRCPRHNSRNADEVASGVRARYGARHRQQPNGRRRRRGRSAREGARGRARSTSACRATPEPPAKRSPDICSLCAPPAQRSDASCGAGRRP